MEISLNSPGLVGVLLYLIVFAWFFYVVTSFVFSHRRQAQAQEKIAEAQAEIAKNMSHRST